MGQGGWQRNQGNSFETEHATQTSYPHTTLTTPFTLDPDAPWRASGWVVSSPIQFPSFYTRSVTACFSLWCTGASTANDILDDEIVETLWTQQHKKSTNKINARL